MHVWDMAMLEHGDQLRGVHSNKLVDMLRFNRRVRRGTGRCEPALVSRLPDRGRQVFLTKERAQERPC